MQTPAKKNSLFLKCERIAQYSIGPIPSFANQQQQQQIHL